jgi:glycosyltransferase involved in cell wall biosynthesis
MISGEDFLVTGLQSWNFALGSNIANIARELSKSNRVLFINYALDRLTLLRNKKTRNLLREMKKKPESSLVRVSDNLWIFTPAIILESINQIRPEWLFNYINRINSRRFAGEIMKPLEKLSFRQFNLFIDSDFYRSFHLKEVLRPRRTLYYIRDNMIATDYYRKHGKRMERALILKSDAVFANSEYLAAYASGINPRSYFVGQGCDLELFNESNIRPQLPDIAAIRDKYRHLIGYIGALKSSRIDIDLLSSLAGKRPEWAIVLVGPEDNIFRSSDLHHHPNVFFLGSKPEKDLPSYIGSFDVAINPQRINLITIGNYPRKIDEYLAMGKPVVASRTKAMEYFSGYTYLAAGVAEFEHAIERALSDRDPSEKQKRIEFASCHTWENNLNNIYRIIEGEINS